MIKCCIIFGLALLQTAALGNEILINLTNQVWRYDQSGAPPAQWYHPAFDDSAWAEGRGVFANETSPTTALSNNVYAHTNTVLLAPLAAADAPNHTVDYFRTHFTFSGNPAHAVLTLSNLVDDGYVAYLNGVEVGRYNMNTNNDLLAVGANPAGEGVYVVRHLCIPTGLLMVGDNVLAVRVHQNAGTSSDVVWGTVLHSSPAALPQIVSPTNTVHIAQLGGRNTNLTVTAITTPCAEYQWFFNSNAIPGATGPGYTITNMDLARAGTYYATVTTRGGSSRSPDFVVSFVTDTDPPRIESVSGDPWDLSMVTVTFSEDVMDVVNPPLDVFTFHIERWLNPGVDVIAAINVQYGSSSNIAIVTLAEPRDPTLNYQLVISNHALEDRFGNRMYDPAVAFVTVPTVFQDGMLGYLGTRDTELRQSSPTSNLGTNASVRCDADLASHGLLRFDNIVGGGFEQLPPYVAIVHWAKLRLYTVDRTSANTPVRLLRMLAPWDQAQSTWDSMGNGIDQTNGVETGTTDALIVADTANAFVEVDVTAAVQAWADGAANYGWALLPTGTDAWGWASSEYSNVVRRPALLVSHSHFDPMCLITKQPEPVTVRAGMPFSLQVLSIGSDLTYEWFRNGTIIPGATGPTYSVYPARLSDNGTYYVVVRNAGVPEPELACTSSTAQVTVFCDDYPVQVLSAIGNVDQSTITLVFSHALEPTAVQNITNYTLSGGLAIAGVSQSGSRITLTNSPERQFGRNYTLTVRNLREDTDCANGLYPNPTVITLTQEVRLLSFDTVWRYQNQGLDLGTAWRQPQYDDSTWPEGPGLLGFETQTIILALSNQNAFLGTWLSRTASSGENIITDYFRTRVNVPFETNGVTFTIRHVTDDGAVFYFNGAEAVRYNMRTGVVDFTTLAPIAPTEGVIRSLTNLTGLTNGWNSVAVEVHQQSALSADILFGAEVIARVPRFLYGPLRILRNVEGSATVSWPQGLAILQEAPDLDGPWTDVHGAVSPLRIELGSGNRFYRLR